MANYTNPGYSSTLGPKISFFSSNLSNANFCIKLNDVVYILVKNKRMFQYFIVHYTIVFPYII